MPKSNKILHLPDPTRPPQPPRRDGLTFTMSVDLDDVAHAVLEELREDPEANADGIQVVEQYLADEDR